ncbi:protein aurora borealis-like isoform X2 [Ptychodera flava]
MDEIDGSSEDKSPIIKGTFEVNTATPEDALIINPFESTTTDTLHLPQFSPSVFSKTTSPSQKKNSESPFQWSIDNIAMLKPVDIDESSQQESVHPDTDLEEKAQNAIDKFFSQKHVVPSPWSEPVQIKHVTFSPNPPSTRYYDGNSSMFSPVNASILNKGRTVDASCQTILSLPVNFDLQAVLGAEFYQESEMDETCMSSLRRKLFFQGDHSEVPSPVKGSTNPSMDQCRVKSPPLSPASHPKHGSVTSDESPVKTPSSNQFSSSPIQEKLTPLKPKRSSILSVAMDTPSLSPIARPILKTPSTGSSGGSGRLTVPMTPSTFRREGTPSTTERLRHCFDLASPDLSPIHQDCSKSLRQNMSTHHETPQKASTSLLYTRERNGRQTCSVSASLHGNNNTNQGKGTQLSSECGQHPGNSMHDEKSCMNLDEDQQMTENSMAVFGGDADCAVDRYSKNGGNGTHQDVDVGESTTQLEGNMQIDSGVNMQSMDIEFTNSENTENFAVTVQRAMTHRTLRSLSTETDSSMDSNIDIDMSIIQPDGHHNDKAATGITDKPSQPWQKYGETFFQENAVIQQMTDVFVTEERYDTMQYGKPQSRVDHGMMDSHPKEFPCPSIINTTEVHEHTDRPDPKTLMTINPIHPPVFSPSFLQCNNKPTPCGNKFYNYNSQSRVLSKVTVPRIINQTSTGAPQFPWQFSSGHHQS